MDNFAGLPPHLLKQFEYVDKVTSPLTNLVPPALQKQLDLIDTLFPPGFRELLEKIEDKHEQLKEAIVALANNGWFVGLSLPLTIQKKALRKIYDLPEQADEILCKYYESRLNNMESELLLRHRDRAEVIKQLFEGHRAELYFLTTPTAFAQVDGICVSSDYQGHLFMRPRGSQLSQIGKKLEQADLCDYQRLLMSPFMNALPITFNPSERADLLQPDWTLH